MQPEVDAPIFQRYADCYDLFHQDKPYEKEIAFVYQWAEKPASIFDVGCGTARYWRFYPPETQLLGLDRSRPMARRAGRSVLQGDVRHYRHRGEAFDCVTALYDVLNYLPSQEWWARLPLKRGGFFVFDVWSRERIEREGFQATVRTAGGLTRRIAPVATGFDLAWVDLRIDVTGPALELSETHRLYLHTHADLVRACGREFELVEVKPTERWQTWYKLIKT